jgi:hypothetical protein
MKILIFLHCWSGEKRFLPPYDSFVDAFLDLGHDVKIIWSHELVSSLYSFSDALSEKHIVRYIRDLDPQLVISFNNGGMTETVRNGIACPVIKWLFDDYPHLFFPDKSQDLTAAMKPGDEIFCYSSNLARQIINRHEGVSSIVKFIPHAASFPRNQIQNPKFNISFIGSTLEARSFANILKHYNVVDPSVPNKLLSALALLKSDYCRPFEDILNDSGLETLLEDLSPHGWDSLALKRALSDAISSQDRMIAVDQLSDLGFALFGNVEWLDSLMFTSDIARSYQFGKFIKTSDDLMEVYQDSRISVDIPNIQNINTLSNRVFDIMASSSLLVTKYQKESDAWSVFGSDCPIPMYENFDHLREICKFYLAHEEERKLLVKKCNELVKDGHSYKARVQMGMNVLGTRMDQSVTRGSIEIIKTNRFRKDHGYKRFSKRMGRKILKKVQKFVNKMESIVT